jgi:uncharacterized protein (DUF885 family)
MRAPLFTIATLLTLALGGCAAPAPRRAGPAGGAGPPRARAPSAPDRASRRLEALFRASDEADLALNPLAALARGDLRYADRFGDQLSDEYERASREKAEADLRGLLAVDRGALPAKQKVAFDAFRYQAEFTLRGYETGASEIARRLPLDHVFGAHVTFADQSSGGSIAPFATVADYENGLRRIDGFVRYLDRAREQMRRGVEGGQVQPKAVTSKMLAQLAAARRAGVEGSPFVGPIKTFPEGVPPPERERLAAAYRAAVGGKILPAYARLEGFLEREYLPAGRDRTPGLASMRGGAAYYAYQTELHTTLAPSAEQTHRLGLAEVARIRAEMDAIRRQVGFGGDLRQFFAHLRADPRFKFASKEALLEGYREIGRRVQPGLARLFSARPKGALEVRPVPGFLEMSAGGAYYVVGAPDGTRPGVFFVNTSDLPSRTSPRMEALFLHEAVPGHHFQGSLAQEDESLPSFLRFGGNAAYFEGWALYAESLGPELGLLTDPHQRFGALDMEMLRALRLAVDTGLHALGWSREQAMRYMLENSSLAEGDVASEVDRYIAWPGQALAYKLGQIAIRRLRTGAEAALGDRFDPRAFHEQVLGTGALPMPVLERKINDWVASNGRSSDGLSEAMVAQRRRRGRRRGPARVRFFGRQGRPAGRRPPARPAGRHWPPARPTGRRRSPARPTGRRRPSAARVPDGQGRWRLRVPCWRVEDSPPQAQGGPRRRRRLGPFRGRGDGLVGPQRRGELRRAANSVA